MYGGRKQDGWEGQAQNDLCGVVLENRISSEQGPVELTV